MRIARWIGAAFILIISIYSGGFGLGLFELNAWTALPLALLIISFFVYANFPSLERQRSELQQQVASAEQSSAVSDLPTADHPGGTVSEDRVLAKVLRKLNLEVAIQDLRFNIDVWMSSGDITLSQFRSTKNALVWGIGNAAITARRATDETCEMELVVVSKEANHVWGKHIGADVLARQTWNQICTLLHQKEWLAELKPVEETRKIIESDLIGTFAVPPEKDSWVQMRCDEIGRSRSWTFFNAGTGTADDFIREQAEREWTDIIKEESVREQTFAEFTSKFLQVFDESTTGPTGIPFNGSPHAFGAAVDRYSVQLRSKQGWTPFSLFNPLDHGPRWRVHRESGLRNLPPGFGYMPTEEWNTPAANAVGVKARSRMIIEDGKSSGTVEYGEISAYRSPDGKSRLDLLPNTAYADEFQMWWESLRAELQRQGWLDPSLASEQLPGSRADELPRKIKSSVYVLVPFDQADAAVRTYLDREADDYLKMPAERQEETRGSVSYYLEPSWSLEEPWYIKLRHVGNQTETTFWDLNFQLWFADDEPGTTSRKRFVPGQASIAEKVIVHLFELEHALQEQTAGANTSPGVANIDTTGQAKVKVNYHRQAPIEVPLSCSADIAAAQLESFHGLRGGRRQPPGLTADPSASALRRYFIGSEEGDESYAQVEFLPHPGGGCQLRIIPNEHTLGNSFWKLGSASLGTGTVLAGSPSNEGMTFCNDFVEHLRSLGYVNDGATAQGQNLDRVPPVDESRIEPLVSESAQVQSNQAAHLWEQIPDKNWDRQVLRLWHEGHTCPEIFEITHAASADRIRNRLTELRKEFGDQIVPKDEQRRKNVTRREKK